MSSFRVTVERLTVFPHPNADALELAQIGLYKTVIAKGQYQTGDLAIFIPEQAIVPQGLLAELGLEGKLGGSKHDRVKAVRLRGELSQGIVARPSVMSKVDYEVAYSYSEDFSEFLGIIKWVPEVPVQLRGEVKGSSELMPWVDIENIKRFPDIFAPSEEVIATEKVHGTCTLFTLEVPTSEVFVSSKGLGIKHLAMRKTDKNLYWRTVEAFGLEEFGHLVAESIDSRQADDSSASPVEYVGIFGETYGAGVQDLTYGAQAGAQKPGYVVFDVSVRYEDGAHEWLSQDAVRSLAAQARIPMVTELYRGPYDAAVIESVADGRESISGQELNIREGVVVRPLTERYSEVLGGRAIGKWVSNTYLTRKGGTEFE